MVWKILIRWNGILLLHAIHILFMLLRVFAQHLHCSHKASRTPHTNEDSTMKRNLGIFYVRYGCVEYPERSYFRYEWILIFLMIMEVLSGMESTVRNTDVMMWWVRVRVRLWDGVVLVTWWLNKTNLKPELKLWILKYKPQWDLNKDL